MRISDITMCPLIKKCYPSHKKHTYTLNETENSTQNVSELSTI